VVGGHYNNTFIYLHIPGINEHRGRTLLISPTAFFAGTLAVIALQW